MKFIFKPLTLDDLQQLHRWFQEPTIRQLYARNQSFSLDDIIHKYKPRLTNHDNVPSFVIESEEQDIGFIQYYCLQDHLPEGITTGNPLFKKYHSHEIVGMDLFIADSNNRGKGLGIQIIHQFINDFLSRYQAVVIDPERKNEHAMRCYKKSGFEMTNYSTDKTHCILILEKQPTP